MTAEESSDEALKDVSSFEALFKAAGTNGRWTVLLFVMCSSCIFVSPFQTLSYQFLGATPDYWCHIEQLVQANWSDAEIISLAIPKSNATKKTESCFMYDYDYAKIADIGYENSILLSEEIKNSSIVPCERRDFNLTQYESTVTTEWDLVCERRVLYSTTQAAVQGGKLVGYLVLGYLLDRLGRRPVVLACSVLTIASGFLSASSPNVTFYIITKVVINIAISGVYLGCFVMSMETCSSEKRSIVGSLFVLPWALSYMVLPGIAYLIRTWQWLQVAFSVPALFLVAYFWILPESPRWLILNGRHQEALKILKKAAEMNNKPFPSENTMLKAMERVGEVEGDKSQTTSKSLSTRVTEVVQHYFALMKIPAFRKRILVCYFCWFGAGLVYYGVSLNATNLSTDPYIYVFLGGLLEVPAYTLLWPANVHIGRTKSLAGLYLICGISILLVMLLMLFAPEAPVGLVMFLSLCGKMAITAAFHLIWMFTIELFPTEYRSLTVGQCSLKARIGSISAPYINDILGEVVVWAPSALFGVVSLVAAGFALFLPETKGRELPETKEFSMIRTGKSNEAYAPDTETSKTGSTTI